MAIELDKTGLARYKKLAENPLYYQNAFNYCGGSLFRAILGYEQVWDKAFEERLMLCLDYLLTDFEDIGRYFMLELTAASDLVVYGLCWPRSVCPQTFKFDVQWPYELQKGEKLVCRVNMLDWPYRADFERANGEVFSIPYRRFYSNLLNRKFLRSERDKKPQHQKRSLRVVGKFGPTEPVRRPTPKLPNLLIPNKWKTPL